MSATSQPVPVFSWLITFVHDNVFSNASSFIQTACTQAMQLGSILLALYICLYGYMFLWGKVKEPVGDFLMRVMKVGFLMLFATSFGVYNDYVVAAMSSWPSDFATSLVPTSQGIDLTSSGSAASFGGPIDTVLGLSVSLLMTTLAMLGEAAGIFSLGSIPIGIAIIVFVGLLPLILTMLLGGIVTFMMVLLEVQVQILSILGPFFILCSLFGQTKGWFNAWLNQVVYVFLFKLIVSLLLLLLVSKNIEIINSILALKESMTYENILDGSLLVSVAGSSLSIVAAVCTYLVMTILVIFFLFEAKSLASALSQGAGVGGGGGQAGGVAATAIRTIARLKTAGMMGGKNSMGKR